MFHPAGSSKWHHPGTFGMPNYRGKALTVGCDTKSDYDCELKTELMDMETLEWSTGPDFAWGE